ncbi:uncharacterized protein LOC123556197 [Mercenaria mercenaria]|uniref:uncharacterized protein LOC123556197 n=1 Tax=Mercenaria mercenaria TaxID=6596 RepID=UPI001E1DCD7B|nr:uncharacterized protein LOC123556197 [Mercenaria mercenaria]
MVFKTLIVTAVVLSVCCCIADGCLVRSLAHGVKLVLMNPTNAYKRSVHLDGVIEGDLCNFETYDGDGDGVIVKEEVRSIMRHEVKLDRLFANLDITGDGKIDEEEFYTSPAIKTVCMGSD